MKNKLLVISALSLLMAPAAFGQNVGVGLNTPATKLHVLQTANNTGIRAQITGTAGNGLNIIPSNAANASSSIFIPNASAGIGMNLNMNNAASTATGIQVTQAGTGTGQSIFHNNSGAGQFINLSVAGNAFSGQQINHPGTGAGSWVVHSGSGSAYQVERTGSGIGVLVDQQGTGFGSLNIMSANNISHINDISTAGGTGSYTWGGGGVNADGFIFINVDNTTTPTTGGDGFAFDGVVNTQTNGGGIVSGGVIAGTQWGVGHGGIITHNGTAGRGFEVNMNNATNTEPNFFGVNNGQGSAFVGQNQNNIIAGTISVADFAYTGTDIADHVGVEGASTPAAGWGVGVLGTGNFYGVFSQGNFGATGTKTFIIDHPEDPENKMLKHFSIESNEVLNMYRGMVELDANGQATVELPSYFEDININASYQLTAVGTPQQPYVLQEIQGNQFVVAGAPNTKVSWTVYADRNDPYMQENPSESQAEVAKTGERQGKYLNPELYGQPASAGMFYNENVENGATPTSAPTPNGVGQYQTPANSSGQKVTTAETEEPVID
ncbi:MAG: hypothetical protein NXI10_01680 [bacterium]|nr:hypothetical protein [bacterium]